MAKARPPWDAAVADLASELLERVEALPSTLVPPVVTPGRSLRDEIAFAVRAKILPELRAGGDLPLLVGVQGGANVGKSTVFNALAGQILSPSIVQAAATKHPLLYGHETWRDRLLGSDVFPGLRLEELDDPRQLITCPEDTDVIYLRFHDDDALERVALIDSPDFDSAVETNMRVAEQVTTISDMTIFVTTGQKYLDRELVARLSDILRLKATVVLVFNQLDEEIVFQTLLDDLREAIGASRDETVALRLPRCGVACPEEALTATLRDRVLGHLASHEAATVKPQLVRAALGRVIEQVGELSRRLAPQVELKSACERFVAEQQGASVASYEDSFRLALPEETLVVRRIIRWSELWPWLQLPEDVQRASAGLRVVSLGIRRGGEAVRRLLVRLSGRDEGSIDSTPEALEDYSVARNETDFEQVHHRAMTLRQEVETFLRSREDAVPLAREAVARLYPPEAIREFSSRLRSAYDERISRETVRGAELVASTDRWIASHPVLCRAIGWVSIALKVSSGVLLARALPGEGFLDLANWAWFVAGYLVAAYVIALLVSLLVRKKRTFRRGRVEAYRDVVQEAISRPALDTLDALAREDDLRALEGVTRGIAERLATDSTTAGSRRGSSS